MSEKPKGDVSSSPRIVKNPLLSASVTGLTFDDFPNKPQLLPAAPPIVHTVPPAPALISGIHNREAKSLVTVGRAAVNDIDEHLDEINLDSGLEDNQQQQQHQQQQQLQALDGNSNVNTLLEQKQQANRAETHSDSILSQAASSFTALPAVASNVFSTFSNRFYSATSNSNSSVNNNNYNNNLVVNEKDDDVNANALAQLQIQPAYIQQQQQPSIGLAPPPSSVSAGVVNPSDLTETTTTTTATSLPEPPKFYTPIEVRSLPTSGPPSIANVQNTYRFASKKKLYAPIPGLADESQQPQQLQQQPSLHPQPPSLLPQSQLQLESQHLPQVTQAPDFNTPPYPEVLLPPPSLSQQVPLQLQPQQPLQPEQQHFANQPFDLQSSAQYFNTEPKREERKAGGGLFSLTNLVPSGVFQNITGLVQSAAGSLTQNIKPNETVDKWEYPTQAPNIGIDSYFSGTASTPVPVPVPVPLSVPLPVSSNAAVHILAPPSIFDNYTTTTAPTTTAVVTEAQSHHTLPSTSDYFVASTDTNSQSLPQIPFFNTAELPQPIPPPTDYHQPQSLQQQQQPQQLLSTLLPRESHIQSSSSSIHLAPPTVSAQPPPPGGQTSFRLQKGTRLYRSPLTQHETAPTAAFVNQSQLPASVFNPVEIASNPAASTLPAISTELPPLQPPTTYSETPLATVEQQLQPPNVDQPPQLSVANTPSDYLSVLPTAPPAEYFKPSALPPLPPAAVAPPIFNPFAVTATARTSAETNELAAPAQQNQQLTTPTLFSPFAQLDKSTIPSAIHGELKSQSVIQSETEAIVTQTENVTQTPAPSIEIVQDAAPPADAENPKTDIATPQIISQFEATEIGVAAPPSVKQSGSQVDEEQSKLSTAVEDKVIVLSAAPPPPLSTDLSQFFTPNQVNESSATFNFFATSRNEQGEEVENANNAAAPIAASDIFGGQVQEESTPTPFGFVVPPLSLPPPTLASLPTQLEATSEASESHVSDKPLPIGFDRLLNNTENVDVPQLENTLSKPESLCHNTNDNNKAKQTNDNDIENLKSSSVNTFSKYFTLEQQQLTQQNINEPIVNQLPKQQQQQQQQPQQLTDTSGFFDSFATSSISNPSILPNTKIDESIGDSSEIGNAILIVTNAVGVINEDQRIQNFFNNPPPKDNSGGFGDLNYDLVHSGLSVKNQKVRSQTPISNLVEPPSSACSEFSELNNSTNSTSIQQPQQQQQQQQQQRHLQQEQQYQQDREIEEEEERNKPPTYLVERSNIALLEKYYADLPEEILQELRMTNLQTSERDGVSVASVPQNVTYTPAVRHWFFKRMVSSKPVWLPFSHYDSALLETSLTNPDIDSNLVPVEGGRYDVNIQERTKTPVYWEGKAIEVRRCSWFYKGVDSKYVPYEEATAELLETEYKRAAESGVWHQKIILSMGEHVVFHGPSVIVHFHQQQNIDAWGGATQTSMRPRVVKRDLDDFKIEQGESQRVDHLLFMVHGIGSACDLKLRTVEEVVDDFREIAQHLIQSHYKNSTEMGLVGRVEVLPISWHSHLHSEELGIDEKLKSITLESIPKLRSFTNDTLLDVLFYTSPTFCQKIMNTVATSLNEVYLKYRSRHPDFSGGVSLSGHSLGSLILFDLLCHQEPLKECEEQNLENPDQHLQGGFRPPNSASQDSISKHISYTMGPAGTGQPYISYTQLIFQPKKFFALGSPIGMFVTIRGIDKLGLDFRLPTCPGFYNIFHPFDPVAYRIEALVNPDMTGTRPVLIPHHKGRKRMHLELKETMTRVGADLKQRFLDTFKTTLESVHFLTSSAKAKKETEETMDKEVNSVLQMQLQLDQQQQQAQQQNDEISQTSSSHAATTRTRTDSVSTTVSDSEIIEIDFSLGKLNDSKRVDYVLQEAPLEFINEYIFALTSHVCYWESEDTILFVMKEIYAGLGISPDSQVPQQSMTIERPNSRNSVSQTLLPL